ncbi:hypothetical protein QO000_000043 [Alkalihalobacillus hemicentroti]|uniref:Uncharacterized protein n=1 Tax=Guptibacillus hwajinpoensis TaxID=208199 RepID=A0ABU0JXA8_9BACL|nr:hypothetical protein [Alkalihalobacillus hemicentroti]
MIDLSIMQEVISFVSRMKMAGMWVSKTQKRHGF